MSKYLILPLVVLVAGCASTRDGPEAGRPRAAALSKEDQSEAITHYLSSIVYRGMGQVDEAIRELRKAADLSPDSTRLQVNLLGAYYLNEDFENAATMAERAIRKEPKNSAYRLWLGRIYYQLERYDEATAAFERAIEIDPDNPDAYRRLAEIEEETNDLVGAIGVYRQMLEIAPDSAFLHYRLGLNLIELGDSEEAQKALERALELNPQLVLAEYLVGVIDLDEGKYESALEHFRHFLESNPSHVRTRMNIAATHARLGDYARSIDVMTRIIESAEVETRHFLLRSYMILRQGAESNSGLAAAPNGSPLLGTVLQALVRKHAGEPYVELIATLDDIEGDLDSECNVYLNEIVSLMGGEEAGGFLAGEIRSLLSEGLRSRVLQTVLARTLMSIDRDEEAVEVLEGILDAYGGEKWLHYYLAMVHENLNHSEQTEKNLRACLDYDSNDPDVLNFLGYFLAEEDRRLGEAEALLDRALKMDPENGFFLDSLGWIYYRQGKSELAIEYIRGAIRSMASDDAILRDHLGDAYLQNGEIKKAIAEWRRALILDREIEEVQKKIEKYLPRVSE
ncbi:MAG: tetratricopeptide repeat protein [Candidatus Hydrogenedentes bacterium]|nr:tetratricopeptide repeat protein [Candidatus Hydrogenedentota bacterium]